MLFKNSWSGLEKQKLCHGSFRPYLYTGMLERLNIIDCSRGYTGMIQRLHLNDTEATLECSRGFTGTFWRLYGNAPEDILCVNPFYVISSDMKKVVMLLQSNRGVRQISAIICVKKWQKGDLWNTLFMVVLPFMYLLWYLLSYFNSVLEYYLSFSLKFSTISRISRDPGSPWYPLFHVWIKQNWMS